VQQASRSRFFFRVVLPFVTALNLVLGFITLSMLAPSGWIQWLEVATGIFCCFVAGWLAAVAWSKAFWGSAMERQVAAWRRVVDTLFRWLEDAPVSIDSMHRLKESLDKVVINGGEHSKGTRLP